MMISRATATQLRDRLASAPGKLFLLDSGGALLTVFFLSVILARFEERFGMPRPILYFLSLIACIYAVYSFCCYVFRVRNWRPYLKGIALANATYCGLTLALMCYYRQCLTILGVTYFLLEIVVVSVLILVELKTAAK